MKKLVLLLSLLISWANVIRAQGLLEVLLDPGSSTPVFAHDQVALGTNGQLLTLWTADGPQLWKCHADGTPEWQVAIGPDTLFWQHSYDMIITPDSAIILAALVDQTQWTTMGSDSSYLKWLVAKLDLSGQVIWVNHYTVTLPVHGGGAGLNITHRDQGLFLNFSHAVETWSFEMNLDANGQMIWSTLIEFPGIMLPPQSYIFRQTEDGAGGVFLVPERPEYAFYFPGWVLHLDSWGQLNWAKSFSYPDSAGSCSFIEPADQPGEFFLFGQTVTPIATRLLRTKIDMTGAPLGSTEFEISLGSGGGRVADVARTATGQYILLWGQELVHLGPDGEFVSAAFHNFLPAPAPDLQNSFLFLDLNASASGVAFLGGLQTIDMLGGTAVSHSVFGHLPYPDEFTTTTGACNEYNVPLIAALAVPPSSVSLPNIIGITSSAIQVVRTPASYQTSPRPLTGSSDYCASLINSITVSDEQPSPFHLLSTLVAQPNPVWVQIDQPIQLSLMAISGALVGSSVFGQPGTTVSMPTDNLAPGLYILTARDLNGGFVGSAKVVVE